MKKKGIFLSILLLVISCCFSLVACNTNPKYKVLIEKDILNGSITSNCNLASKGTPIVLSIVPNAGYKLKEGSLKINGVSSKSTFKMPAKDVTINAEFEAIDYKITIDEKISNGIVKTNIVKANIGNEIKLTITPNKGYEYVEDSLKINGVKIFDNCFIMPAENVNITADFKIIDYDIKCFIDNGKISPNVNEAKAGTEVTLTIEPYEGYKFILGSLKANGIKVIDNKFTMPAKNVNLTAEFEKINYSITIDKKIKNGKITPDFKKATIGDSINLNVIPNINYECIKDSLKANGIKVIDNKFIMPAENVKITAKFKPYKYAITIENTKNGTITTNVKEASNGDQIKLNIIPNEGYVLILDSLKVNEATIYGGQFIMPDYGVSITAEFEKIVEHNKDDLVE